MALSKRWHAVERFIDISIPFWLLGLALVIIASFFVHLENYEPWISIFDALVTVFFVADLCFKWYHVQNLKRFVRLYWIDILAVFPFYVVFRVWILVQSFAQAGESAQKIVHEAILLRESKLLEEAEFLKKADLALRESEGLTRALRFIERSLRLFGFRMHTAHAAVLKQHKQVRTSSVSR